MIKNDLFLRAFNEETLERFPVWLMRQAGRYQPSYQAIRKNYPLLEMFTNPEIAARVTLLPVNELHVDAAILFSDILLILKALGLEVVFEDGKKPCCSVPIRSKSDIATLRLKPVEEVLGCVKEAIHLIKPELHIPLIGFAGGPFTVASYAISNFMAFFKEEGVAFTELINIITDKTIDYLKMQQQAGVDCVQIFDSWANLLEGEDFEHYSLAPLRKIKAALHPLKVIYFSRGSAKRAKVIEAAAPDAISFDHEIPLHVLQAQVNIPIQGNFDPNCLLTDVKTMESTVKPVLEKLEMKKVVINLGHGVLKQTPYDNVKAFVDLVQAF